MKTNKLVLVMMMVISLGLSGYPVSAADGPVLTFSNKSAIKFDKVLKVGQVELLEFAQPVSLAHYGTDERSLDYIELEKLAPSQKGYRKFMIKAKKAGSGELTFEAGQDIIKVRVLVEANYELLEKELNNLFGIANANDDERIRVISANIVNTANGNIPHIYLKGLVESAKNSLLAVSFAANALGDHGVKIYSNPGGQLRLKDLDKNQNQQQNLALYNFDDSSFAEYYETTNKLIDTDNLYRDLVLASENERVISYLRIKEPKRYAVQVRFLEMESKYVDDFLNSISSNVFGGDVQGTLGTNDMVIPSITRTGNFNPGVIADNITGGLGSVRGIPRLTDNIVSGNLVSGATKLFDNVFLNFNLNDLLQEGILRVVNEFSLVTHSGELVSLGKGTRFPVPRQNNGVGNTAISFEYIPVGFKGELKVTGLENSLIDVQLASRLSAADATVNTFAGFPIPIFTEEYVNSGALLADGQEVILNTFLTESETVARTSSPLGRILPFLGRSKRKQKSKSLLFIAIQAEEIELSSKQVASADLQLPHVDHNADYNIYDEYNRKLRARNIGENMDIKDFNQSEAAAKLNSDNLGDATRVDPLELDDVDL